MTTMYTDLTTTERVDAVYEAQEHMRCAYDLIQTAVRGTRHEGYVDAYILAHLKIMMSSGHGYLSRDTNLDDVMRWLEGGEEDEEELSEG